MTITTISIDLAKNVFVVHCIDQNDEAVLIKPKMLRAALSKLTAGLPPHVIGMEACSGAHYWARSFRQYGHDVRLVIPKFVSPYRIAGKAGKSDTADAIAICEAVQWPHIRFVPVKDESQQTIQCLHRTRQGLVWERTATCNRLWGLISEFRVITPQSADALRHVVSDQKGTLPVQIRLRINDLLTHVTNIEERITEYDRVLSRVAKTDHHSQQLVELRGVGPTTANALVASIDNAHDPKNRRQLTARLGLTPSQYSGDRRSKLSRITKTGDAYLRTLLVQGARSVTVGIENRTDPFNRWVYSLIGRRGYRRVAVAIATKNVRLCWASLHYGDDFRLCSTT